MQPRISLLEILLLGFIIFSCTNEKDSTPGHYEAMTYQLRANASPQDYLSINKKVEVFLKNQPGFIGRNIGQLNDSVWVDISTWKSKKDFETAYQKSEQVNSVRQMSEMIDESSFYIFSFDPIADL